MLASRALGAKFRLPCLLALVQAVSVGSCKTPGADT